MKDWFGNLYADIGGRKGLVRLLLITALACSLLVLDLYSGLESPDSVNINGLVGLVLLPGLVYGLSLSCFSLILPRSVCRIVFSVILGWVFFFAIADLMAREQFGVIIQRTCTIMILVGSSWEEISNFVRSYPQIHLILLLGIILIVGLAKCTYFDAQHGRRRLFRLFLLGQLPLVIWLFISPGHGQTFAQRMRGCSILQFPSVSFWYFASCELSTFKDMTHASVNPDLPSRLDCRTNKDSPLLAVIVIGESATRNRWSLYGYERKTNPYLDSRKSSLCVFSDLVAPNHMTTGCLRYFLSTATKEDEGCRYLLPSVCKRAGYECSLLSNQPHWGRNDGTEVVLFSACDRRIWLEDTFGQWSRDKHRYDSLLLPYIQCEVVSTKGNKVLIVHPAGSHFEYDDRYPVESAVFGLDANGKMKPDITRADHYDNSTVYSDYILNEIIKQLELRGGDSLLLYLSDHGESPRGGKNRFVQDRDVWEIPMFAWFSDGYRAHYPDVVESMYKAREKPLVSDQLLFGVTRLLRIEGVPGYTEGADFLSDAFVPRKKRYEDFVNLDEKR